MRSRFERVIRSAAAGVVLCLLPAALWSQEQQPPKAEKKQASSRDVPYMGKAEIGGFVGGSFGVDQWRVMGGGNVAIAAQRYVLPYFEYSYFPGLQRKMSLSRGEVRYSVPLSDFHAGVHIRFPRGQTPVMPYLVAGAGGVRSSDTNVQVRFSDGFTFSDTIKGSTDFAVNFGGGIRYYTRESVGFRPRGQGVQADRQLHRPVLQNRGRRVRSHQVKKGEKGCQTALSQAVSLAFPWGRLRTGNLTPFTARIFRLKFSNVRGRGFTSTSEVWR